jgi:L-amino acid N-acyltransferase YncA
LSPTDRQPPVSVRRATTEDAEGIVAIWQEIVAERSYSAVDVPFGIDEEREYIRSLSSREGIFVALSAAGHVVGFQSLDQWTKLFRSMDHVGQLGTFVAREWRGCGVGTSLAKCTFDHARANGFEKLVIYVRAGNTGAQTFYASLGFVPCGHLRHQVKIAGEYDDEILMELRL